MKRKTLEHRTKRILEDGEFLAEWLNRMEAGGLKEALDRGVEALSRRPLPRDYFKKIGMRLKGKVVPQESDASRREAKDFLTRHFFDENFLFWLCIFCLQMEVGRRKVREMFGYTLPGFGETYTWKDFLEVLRRHLPGAEKWVESDAIRLRLSELRVDFDVTFRGGRGGRLLFEFVPVNEQSRALQALGRLIESDNIGRIRKCPHCKLFFFAGQRNHKLFCSHRCQTAHWQRTPEGRAYKAAQMRDVRATAKKLWEAKQRGRKLKQGRNVHVSLKKGE